MMHTTAKSFIKVLFISFASKGKTIEQVVLLEG